ncbi:MBL fold metallo-hydrolase RNA specificity domain-containing protein [Aeoliella mucimassa]|uniref:Ribonuclease n=1 Tax=Aeoliella mucimassa TaxID=2527972 RepID=A0A518AU43_9BACT|nr:MBL fold metallo-hydrolase [Aeoliella mucimassa]QDU58216.1 Ribonuclease [Aeoliella mucimassa]
MTQLTFHGAARTVTGSKYLLEADGARVLIDCGMFQGLKKLRELNWQPTPFDIKNLDAVLLTHAHLDHCGYLPRIVRQGYHNRIFCTPATAKLAEIIMLDSAKIQEHDADYANKKGFSKHKPALPLYEGKDVLTTVKLLREVERENWHQVAGPIWARFHDAGHLLGSNMIEVEVRNREKPLRILFSGDVGRYDGPLYFDPTPPPECDVLVCESTYGNRDHPDKDLSEGLADVFNRAVKRGGVILMASFAVGRAQQLIYLMQVLKSEGKIPDLPIYLDSPMSCNATDIYREHSDDHDLAEGDLNGERPVLGGPAVHLCRSVDESKGLNNVDGPAVIISSSGMMTAGRILHHLKRRLPDKRNTVVLGGYMAVGTRGRALEQGAPTIRMHGMDVPVNAAIEKVPGLSGHADRSGLLRWLSGLKQDPRQVFLTHGEPDSAEAFADTLAAERGWKPIVPEMGESHTLD